MGRYIWPPLPKTWQLVRLGDLATISYGKALKAENRQSQGSFVVYGSGGAVGTHDEYMLEGPTIIIGRKGTVGAIYYTDKPFWCIDTAYYLEELDASVDIEYLAYLLRYIDLARLTIVVGVPGLNRQDLASVELPLPSLPEQQLIVKIFKQADDLRHQRQEILDQGKQLPAALFLEMFGDPTKWGTHKLKLGSIATFITSGSRDWSKYYSPFDSDAKFIRVQNVKAGELDLSDLAYVQPPENAEAARAKVQPGDLLISITGTVGQVAVVPASLGEAYISQHVALVRTDGTLPVEFLVEFLNHPAGGQLQIQRANYGQTKPGLNLQQIRNLSIPMFDAEKIARSISAKNEIATIKRAYEVTITGLDQLQQSLHQEGFTGNLTENWRKAHRAELEKWLRDHTQQLQKRTTRISFTEIATAERIPANSSRRYELLNQLSELQGFVLDALRDWKGTLIPTEHLQKFMGQWPVEHLEDLHDQVLRALDQLAGLGLVARVSIPNQQGEYVTGYRVLRDDELTKFSDLQFLGAPA